MPVLLIRREMSRESKLFKQDGGAYPKSEGNSTLMPRLPVLTFCFLLFVARLASSVLPAGSLLGHWVADRLAGLLAGASWLLGWAG